MSKNKDSRAIKAEAQKLVRSLNISADNKEQTQQVVNGVQRAMEAFLRQQSEKSRELDKKIKKVDKLKSTLGSTTENEKDALTDESSSATKLPWVLFAGACCVIAGLICFPGLLCQ